MSTLELENIKHPDNSGDNIALASNGSITIDRKSTDGTIAEFRKDGTAAGSISIKSDDLVIHSLVQNHAGLSFGDGNLLPTNYYGTTSNNTVDIGRQSQVRLACGHRTHKNPFLVYGIHPDPIYQKCSSRVSFCRIHR